MEACGSGNLIKGNGANDDPRLLSKQCLRNLLHMEEDFNDLRLDPADYHVIVDIGASRQRMQWCVGECPTITRGRAGSR
eukprot:1720689-Karenia_brevis.AAC.1